MRHTTRSLLSAALLVLALAASAFAFAPIDGKWVGTMQGPDGPGQVNLELKADGETLSGSLDLFGLVNGPIANGKISAANEVSFDMTIAEAGLTLPFKGKLEGDKLNLTLESPMGSQTVAFARPPAS
jgi:hypothetical protein